MVSQRLDMFPVECVVRGYLTGSGLSDYDATGAVCGIALPAGCVDGSRLPEPIFTPATKAELGEHDENVDFEAVVETRRGRRTPSALRTLTLQVYARADAIARERGIIVADTKFEFGRDAAPGDRPRRRGAHPRLVALLAGRPATSRATRSRRSTSSTSATGSTSPASGWDQTPPTRRRRCPTDVVEQTRAKYVEAYERLTGRTYGLKLDVKPPDGFADLFDDDTCSFLALATVRSTGDPVVVPVWFVADARDCCSAPRSTAFKARRHPRPVHGRRHGHGRR